MSGTVVWIPLRSRKGELLGVAQVDAQDMPLAAFARWRFHSAGYAVGAVAGRQEYLHRLVLGLRPGDGRQGDHKNGDRLDCRRSNLRVVGWSQQRTNASSRGGVSQHRGVYFDKRRGHWYGQVQYTQGGKRRRKSTRGFATEEQAAEAIHVLRERLMPGEPNRR